MLIRAFHPADLPHLLTINQAATPGVSSETQDSLARWIGLSTAMVARNMPGGPPIGFLTLIEPGTTEYPSANLRWFEDRQAREGTDTVYVDRVAVSPDARGTGVGAALYRHAFARYADRGEIGCEINVRPPNPGSERFHRRLGFRKIGERAYEGGEKAVGYWVRPLAAD